MAKLALGLACFAVVCVAGLYFFQRALIYQPDSEAPSTEAFAQSGFRPITVTTADGVALVFWLRKPATPDGVTLVLFHGNAGHHGDRLFLDDKLHRAGLGLALASYRGYGGNPGTPSEAGLYADGRAIVDALDAEGIAPRRTVLWGESLGAGVVTRLAAERPSFRAVILQAPFTSLIELGGEIFPLLPMRLLARERYDNLSRIGAIAAPLLIVHGEADEVVPVGHGRWLFAAASQPKTAVFIPGARHNDLADFGLVEILLAFLAKLPPE